MEGASLGGSQMMRSKRGENDEGEAKEKEEEAGGVEERVESALRYLSTSSWKMLTGEEEK
jgi:hypothetical protein